MTIDLPTIILSPEIRKENLHIANIRLFEDDDEHGSIFLEGWKNFRMIQRAFLF